MSFSGFGPNALGFFKALAFHQTKEWFEANRSMFEDEIKTPLGDLVETLSARFVEASIPLTGSRKGSVFRIHRDVRFSKNKEPYKTNGSALMSRSGTKNDVGILYVHLGTDGCFAAAGFYLPEPPILRRLRDAIVRDPAAFARVCADLERRGLALGQEQRLARLPRGFEDVNDDAVVHALKYKSLVCSRPFTQAQFESRNLVEDLVVFAGDALSLLRWGWSAAADVR